MALTGVIRSILSKIIIVCISLALTLGLLELVVRGLGSRDSDGQFTFMGYALPPHPLPVNRLRDSIDRYISKADAVTIIYDGATGWTYRPHSLRHNGTFSVNGDGFRSRVEYSREPPADALRIAAFGDSFTADDDVDDERTWTRQLELALADLGMRAQVLNFGVGGYDMGQAYLRWGELGRQFAPDIVIFGFQPENLDRNVNVFRLLYIHGDGIPHSKPRFALEDGDLALVNMPPIPPERMVAAFESFASHPLAAYEAYYVSRKAASSFWAGSRLLAFLHTLIQSRAPVNAVTYERGSERGDLGVAIVDAFAGDVALAGAHFMIAHLPLQQHLAHLAAGGASPFAYLQEYFADAYAYVPLERQLVAYADARYHGTTGHYLAEITQVIGRALADAIHACIDDGSCMPGRFPGRDAFLISR